jgi:hypothetical protein
MGKRILATGLGACWLALGVAAASGNYKDDLKKDIDRAIKSGTAFLKKTQTKDGNWSFGGSRFTQLGAAEADVGATALAALALLECGLPAKDAAVIKAASFVRKGSLDLTGTYSLSLAIMFLDRLGEAADVPLIESMTVRLLAGQDLTAGWSYYCPGISKEEKQRLAKVIEDRDELVSQGKVPKKREAKVRTVKDLPKEITTQLVQINLIRPGSAGEDKYLGRADNSNTQFAIIALWISHRLGFPVQDALRRTDRRFRQSQETNGGWAYVSSTAPPRARHRSLTTAAMTCAGLLGLAMGHGAVNLKAKEKNPNAGPATNPDKDVAIKAGLVALATTIGQPVGKDREQVPLLRNKAGWTYYYLWSLERVAMVYGLEKIGNKDWYSWGAEILIANQTLDGSWAGSYPEGGVDTSFALLFLCRSNLTPDLTASLKGRIKKAGETALTAGGVGGRKLVEGQLGKGMKAGIGGHQDPPEKQDQAGRKNKSGVIQASAEEQDREITRLSTEFVRASGEDQESILTKLKSSKGVVYTEALAGSIPLLKGGMKVKARNALARRLTRMSTETLKDKLKDDNLEIRRAAALACALKKAKAHIPRLIALLEDPELAVALAAHQALKDLSGEDFGPEADATRAERKEAVAQWKAWWKKRSQ